MFIAFSPSFSRLVEQGSTIPCNIKSVLPDDRGNFVIYPCQCAGVSWFWLALALFLPQKICHLASSLSSDSTPQEAKKKSCDKMPRQTVLVLSIDDNHGKLAHAPISTRSSPICPLGKVHGRQGSNKQQPLLSNNHPAETRQPGTLTRSRACTSSSGAAKHFSFCSQMSQLQSPLVQYFQLSRID